MPCLDGHAAISCGPPRRPPPWRCRQWGCAAAYAEAAGRSPDAAADDPETFDAAAAAEVSAAGPLMVCVHDAEGGDVSILHGTEEIVVNDRRLVAKIVRAKSGAKRA